MGYLELKKINTLYFLRDFVKSFSDVQSGRFDLEKNSGKIRIDSLRFPSIALTLTNILIVFFLYIKINYLFVVTISARDCTPLNNAKLPLSALTSEHFFSPRKRPAISGNDRRPAVRKK